MSFKAQTILSIGLAGAALLLLLIGIWDLAVADTMGRSPEAQRALDKAAKLPPPHRIPQIPSIDLLSPGGVARRRRGFRLLKLAATLMAIALINQALT
jgi:hypothetical protein